MRWSKTVFLFFLAMECVLADPPQRLQALNLGIDKDVARVPKELVSLSSQLVQVLDSSETWRICFLEMPELTKEQALKIYWKANYPDLPQPEVSGIGPLKPRLRERPEDGVPRRLIRAFAIREDVWVFEYAFDGVGEPMTNGAVFVLKDKYWRLVHYNIYLADAIKRATEGY